MRMDGPSLTDVARPERRLTALEYRGLRRMHARAAAHWRAYDALSDEMIAMLGGGDDALEAVLEAVQGGDLAAELDRIGVLRGARRGDAIGARIAARRKALGWGQADLAREIGRHQTTVAGAEVGRYVPRRETVERYATALGVDPDWLETGEEKE